MRDRARWRPAAFTAAALIVAALAYAVVPRKPDLFAFDPSGLGRTEAAMWRDYYEKRPFGLFAHLFEVSRTQYGFSPWQSVRIAVAAARAARAFQPSRSRAEGNAALPFLIDYFGLLSAATPVRLDVADAAAAELDWWQARRENATPDRYGLIIARVTALIYGIDNAQIREAGVMRANAMAHRDARGAAITEADWSEIERELATCYALLRRGLSAGAAAAAR